MVRVAMRDSSAVAARSGRSAKRDRTRAYVWADVCRAARVARAEGVTLRVHGIVVSPVLKQHKKDDMLRTKVQQQPVEATVPPPPAAAADDSSSPPPLSKRKQRSAQRLLVYQEKMRAARLADTIQTLSRRSEEYGRGHTPEEIRTRALEKVASRERRRLARCARERMQSSATPMEVSASVERSPPGSSGGTPSGEKRSCSVSSRQSSEG